MVDKLSLLGKQFSHLPTAGEREKLGNYLGFNNDNLLCLVACSGGPDSLFLAVFIYRYRHIVKGLPMSITKILHFKHSGQQCDQEAYDLVTLLFGSSFEIIYSETDGSVGKITETVLRKQRQSFYTNTIQRFYSTLQSVGLCLGHHHDDRIENSFLHMERGSGVKGIVNMTVQENKRILAQGVLLPYTVFRPLLSYTKESIVTLCRSLKMDYIEDIHNKDATQKRIVYRKRIALQSHQKKNEMYTDRSFIYSYLESDHTYESFFPVFSPSFRPCKQLYCATTPQTISQLQQQLTWCGLYTNISEKRLQNLLHTFGNAQAFYLQGRWFLQRKGQTFFGFTGSKKRFWEENYALSIEIQSLGKYELAGFDGEITDRELIGGIVCFPQFGDKVGSLSYLKWAAKQGIPFFLRRSLPIIKKNNRIYSKFTLILGKCMVNLLRRKLPFGLI